MNDRELEAQFDRNFSGWIKVGCFLFPTLPLLAVWKYLWPVMGYEGLALVAFAMQIVMLLYVEWPLRTWIYRQWRKKMLEKQTK